MNDEQARAAIGEALLHAFAARPDAPPELAALLDRLDTPPPRPRGRTKSPLKG